MERKDSRREFKTDPTVVHARAREIDRKGGYPQPVDMEAEAAETNASWDEAFQKEGAAPDIGHIALQEKSNPRA